MKRFITLAIVLLLSLSSQSMAGLFGPATSLTEPGSFYLGGGYTYFPADIKRGNLRELETKQNQLFIQGGMGLTGGWEVYVRGGIADWQVENGYLNSGDESDSGVLPFGSVGVKGPVYIGKYLTIGPFFQASYFSLYDDDISVGTVDVVVDGTSTEITNASEKIYFDNLWEFNAGITLQMMMEGAYLYGGPFYYVASSEYRSVISGDQGSFRVADTDLEEDKNIGAFIGVRWPLKNGLSIDFEGLYKSDFSLGAAVHYAF